MSKTIKVNPLKIKGKYVSIHSSPVSEQNQLKTMCPWRYKTLLRYVRLRQGHTAADTTPINTPLRKPQDSHALN